jgi:hypothetical protein
MAKNPKPSTNDELVAIHDLLTDIVDTMAKTPGIEPIHKARLQTKANALPKPELETVEENPAPSEK